eukprot:6176318-Pleurochrysis_carterae.AAC.1
MRRLAVGHQSAIRFNPRSRRSTQHTLRIAHHRTASPPGTSSSKPLELPFYHSMMRTAIVVALAFLVPADAADI